MRGDDGALLPGFFLMMETMETMDPLSLERDARMRSRGRFVSFGVLFFYRRDLFADDDYEKNFLFVSV